MQPHLLIVDDEPQIRELLSLYFNKHGYTVSTASNATDTLRMASELPLDMIILDIGLAEEDGLKVLAAIKAAHPKLRVIMLTGMGFVEDLLQEAHQKGADGYVSKVLPLDELLMTVQRTLKAAKV